MVFCFSLIKTGATHEKAVNYLGHRLFAGWHNLRASQ
jgi:hypothetical protein